ncbi:DEAD/DEAH box helicase [Salimicrobium halophilum]|uniref:AAA domain-containing protein n=1 Tax=Salimicrobium halophilum TaxID=86666 RepID=A0A1G8S0D6_9BACI|nr:DEAD/DEAH box helicase [Salimicrobium halophilum]SDJ22663.1 AAA domain-containing protein [Salimicrobium halophilum]
MDFTNYFRNSLIDAERFATRYSDIKDRAVPLSLDELREGKVTEQTAKQLFNEEHSSLEILINPLLLYKESTGTIAPLWIPAKLLSSGRLAPHPRDIPWMSMYYLSPSRTGERSIGHMEDYERFFQNHGFTFHNWPEVFTFASELFSYVTGYKLDTFTHESYKLLGKASVSIKSDSLGDKAPLIHILDDLKKKDQHNLPSLYRSFISLEEQEKEKIDIMDTYTSSNSRHLGHIPGNDALSDSQRQGLDLFLSENERNFFAMNGPPGTGKSMLLTCVFASRLVESTIEEKQAPPLLVATAHDQFTAMDLAGDYLSIDEQLHKRWLPNVNSYSLYASREPISSEWEVSRYHLDGPSSFREHMEDTEYVNQATQAYLKEAGSYFKNQWEDIREVTDLLHGELMNTVSDLKGAFRILEDGSEREVEKWLKNHGYEGSTKEDMASCLDLDYRTKAFSLAARYWEGRFLLEHEPDPQAPFLLRFQSFRKIAPLLVIPIADLPLFLTEEETEAPAYEAIDLLMIEESGQLLPEMAAAAVSLTKNILAIGDVHQVKPLFNITKTFDFANILNNGWTDKEHLEPELINSGLAASSGSMLRVCQRLSRFHMHPEVSGVFLTEHRRSVPEVINYCNELMYHNWLKPIRPPIEQYPFPHLGIEHVNGEVTRHKTGLSNKVEVKRMIEWIEAQKDTLQSFYESDDLSTLIAIVTPFAEQKEEIENQLEASGLYGFTVGTIHMMQGASSPVVLFSSVYQKDTSSHMNFDEDSTLLNVAVSRAKDAFLVFGNEEIFSKGGDTPSSLLSKHLQTI